MKDGCQVILESTVGRVLTITLNRPERQNTVTAELVVKLHEALMRAAADPGVGAIVLTGAGETFCAGGDIARMANFESPNTSRLPAEELLDLGAETSLLLHRMAKPTIAMINGVAVGGGLALAAACDFRLCSDTSRFTFSYIKVGLSGDFAASYLMQKVLGTTRAREFCLLSPIIDAKEAWRIGLVNRIYPVADLKKETYAFAEQLANGPNFALGQLKVNLNAAVDLPVEEAVRVESENFIRCRETDDHRKAVRAYMEKQKRKAVSNMST